MEQVVSDEPNPVPVISIVVPTWAEAGSGVKPIMAEVGSTWKAVEAQSAGHPPAPSTLTVYNPGAVLATTNDADAVLVPLPIEQEFVELTAGLTASNVQEASALKKPVPNTETVTPGEPKVMLRVIDGGRIVNGTTTTSPAPLVAVTVTV